MSWCLEPHISIKPHPSRKILLEPRRMGLWEKAGVWGVRGSEAMAPDNGFKENQLLLSGQLRDVGQTCTPL